MCSRSSAISQYTPPSALSALAFGREEASRLSLARLPFRTSWGCRRRPVPDFRKARTRQEPPRASQGVVSGVRPRFRSNSGHHDSSGLTGPDCGTFSYGETQTRTGDTTIFRRPPERLGRSRFAGLLLVGTRRSVSPVCRGFGWVKVPARGPGTNWPVSRLWRQGPKACLR